jgi:hypothetical protein
MSFQANAMPLVRPRQFANCEAGFAFCEAASDAWLAGQFTPTQQVSLDRPEGETG